jgi:hypothetical protein
LVLIQVSSLLTLMALALLQPSKRSTASFTPIYLQLFVGRQVAQIAVNLPSAFPSTTGHIFAIAASGIATVPLSLNCVGRDINPSSLALTRTLPAITGYQGVPLMISP